MLCTQTCSTVRGPFKEKISPLPAWMMTWEGTRPDEKGSLLIEASMHGRRAGAPRIIRKLEVTAWSP
jgi:hypothetical protein